VRFAEHGGDPRLGGEAEAGCVSEAASVSALPGLGVERGWAWLRLHGGHVEVAARADVYL
jgi:hypothetical protein